MEITPEQQEMVEVIKSWLKCPLDFKCERSGFTDYPKVRCVGEDLECFEQEAPY